MSERPKYQIKIDERIMAYPFGTAFSASDFLDIAEANSVSQALFRIEKEGKIRRVMNGIYDKPAYSELIQEYGMPRRDYMIGKIPLKFKHVMPREINGYSAITVMIIQGIRAIGKGNMTREQADCFAAAITAEDYDCKIKRCRTGRANQSFRRMNEESRSVP